MGDPNYNWLSLLADAKEAIQSKNCAPSWRNLSIYLGIPRSTLREGFAREFGITSIDLPNLDKINEAIPGDEQISITNDSDNLISVNYQGNRIISLEDLVKAAKIDLNKWIIERWMVNKWEVGAKTAKKTLSWSNGILDGDLVDDGELTVEPLFQVKVWLKLKTVQSEGHELPPIQPIEIVVREAASRKKAKTNGRGLKTAVIIPDIQFGFQRDIYTGKLIPFHDRHALDVALQIVEFIKPDKVVYLGDNLDLPDWSDRFLRSPEFYWTTQPAIVEASWWFSQFKQASMNAEHKMMPGNHEKRMEEMIVKYFLQAYNLKPVDEMDKPSGMTIQRLLALDKIGIEYSAEPYPDSKIWLGDYIVCVHGRLARSGPGSTVGAVIKNTDITTIQGHIHRIELVSKTINLRDRRRVVHAFSPGCLCKIDGSVPGSSTEEQWQQGIGIVFYEGDSDRHTIVPVPIKDGTAIYNGYMFGTRDRLKDLQKDTNWNFSIDNRIK